MGEGGGGGVRWEGGGRGIFVRPAAALKFFSASVWSLYKGADPPGPSPGSATAF